MNAQRLTLSLTNKIENQFDSISRKLLQLNFTKLKHKLQFENGNWNLDPLNLDEILKILISAQFICEAWIAGASISLALIILSFCLNFCKKKFT